jgi:hypothetical protein
MGASKDDYISLVNGDGQIRNDGKTYFYRWKAAEAKIKELEEEIKNFNRKDLEL